MPIKHQLVTLVFAALLISSCSSIYMPSVPNTPMLTTKGEFAGGAHISLKGNASFNTAYAVTEHFAVMANAGFMNNEGRKKDINHKVFEFGGGYFKTFGPENNRILEIYGGLANGRSKRTFREYENDVVVSSDFYDAAYSKKFVQVNYSSKKVNDVKIFGFKFGLNYGTAWRLSFVETDDFYKNGVMQPNEDNVFLEPVFFTRMVLSEQIQLQYTSGSNIGLKSRKFLNAGHSVFTVGAVVNIGRKPKTK